jgi:hypothetical protein
MSRWFLGIASLFLTLLAGGCLPMRPARLESASANSPSSQSTSIQPTTFTNPPDLPTRIVHAKPTPPTGVATVAADGRKWPEHTIPPPVPPTPPQLLVGLEPKVESVNPVIETATRHPLVLALECALDNRHQQALWHLQKYDERTQLLVLRMLAPFSLVAKNTNLSAADIAALNDKMAEVMRVLQQNSEFAISRLCFCESIKDFAIFKPLPGNHEFLSPPSGWAGEEIHLYVGFKNFASEKKEGQFETKLSSRIRLVDGKGQTKLVHRFSANDLTLVSPMQLAEYYHHYHFYLPPKLPSGSYTLVVELTDETVPSASRTVIDRLPLRIASAKD